MAMIFPTTIKDDSRGVLSMEIVDGVQKIYFTPIVDNTIASEFVNLEPIEKWNLIDINQEMDAFTMYPFRYYEDDSISSKYRHLSKITLIGFRLNDINSIDDISELLERLPSVFVKDYNYGLGLRKDYASIISAVECFTGNGILTHLIITKKGDVRIDSVKRELTIAFAHLEEMRKGINRVISSSRSVANILKDRRMHNMIAFYLNDTNYPQKPVFDSQNLMSRLTGETLVRLEKEESKNAIETIKRNTKRIVKENPEEIVKLKNDLELVSLEQLIKKFGEMLDKKLNENIWQKLFNENPFILSMAFGYPVVKIKDQASVGGRKISGDGDKIVDYLMKNSLSNNTALFEIKTPTTRLLNQKVYRDNVYNPSSDLAGAVNQILDQKYHFEQSIMNIRGNSRIYDMESYHVHGVLIIGKLPTEIDQQKSFELFRGNSKSIAIITFDEVLEKLKILHTFLCAEN